MERMIVSDMALGVQGDRRSALVYAKQGDRRTRFLRIQLMEEDAQFPIPVGWTAVVNVQKPDGTFCRNICTVENGKILVELTNQTLAAAGSAQCDVELRDKTGEWVLSSNLFTLQIENSMRCEGAILSSNEMTALDEIVQTWLSDGEQARQRMEEMERQVQCAEQERAQSEGRRQTAEQGRVQAEQLRVQQETQRQSKEAERQAAEVQRQEGEKHRTAAEFDRQTAMGNALQAAENERQAAKIEHQAAMADVQRAAENCRKVLAPMYIQDRDKGVRYTYSLEVREGAPWLGVSPLEET